MTVGFIGLGTMGGRMCRNVIAKSGHEVIVYDLSTGAVEACTRLGATAAAGIGELAAAADVILTSMPTPAAMETVTLGPGGIAQQARPGTVHFDLTTNSLALVKRAAAVLAERGITLLDSPVSGGPAGAEAGTLSLMVGGDAEVFEQHLPLLTTFAASPIHVGELGHGTIAKVVNNLLAITAMTTAAEGLMLGTTAGIDPRKLDEVVRSSSGNSLAWRSLAERAVSGDYSPSFALDLCYKDIHLALELADELRVPSPQASAAADLMRMGLGMGYAKLDPTIVFHVYEQVLGRQPLAEVAVG